MIAINYRVNERERPELNPATAEMNSGGSPEVSENKFIYHGELVCEEKKKLDLTPTGSKVYRINRTIFIAGDVNNAEPKMEHFRFRIRLSSCFVWGI